MTSAGSISVQIDGDDSALTAAVKRAVGALRGIPRAASTASDGVQEAAKRAANRITGIPFAAQRAAVSFKEAFKSLPSSISAVPDAVKKAVADIPALEEKFNSAREASSKFSGVSSALTSVGASFAAAGAAGVAFGGIVAKIGSDVEQAVTEAAAIAGGPSGFESSFAAMKKATIDTAAATKFSGREIGAAFKYLAMSGQDATTAIASMPQVARLAAASGIELGASADIVSNIMAGYGKSANEIADANNVLVGTFTKANTSLPELGEAFRVSAAIGKSTGVSFEELSAAIGILGNAGIKGADAGQGLKMAMINLAGPTDTARKAQEQLGISGKMLANQGLGAVVDRLRDVRDAMAAQGKETEFVGTLIDAFGTRAGPRMATLIGMGKGAIADLVKELEKAKKQDLSKFLEEKQLSTFSGNVEMLTGAMESFGMVLADALVPLLKDITKVVTKIVDGFNGLSPTVKSLIADAFVFGTALSAVALGLGGIAVAVGAAMPALTAFASFLGVSVGASLLLAAKAALIVVAALGVFYGAFRIAEQIMVMFGGTAERTVSVFQVIGDAIEMFMGSAKGALDVVGDLILTVIAVLTTPFRILPVVGKYFEDFLELVQDGFHAVSSAAQQAVESMGGTEAAVASVSSPTKKMMKDTLGLGDAADIAIEGKMNGALKSTETRANKAAKAFESLSKSVSDSIKLQDKLATVEGARGIVDLADRFADEVGEMKKLAKDALVIVPKFDRKKLVEQLKMKGEDVAAINVRLATGKDKAASDAGAAASMRKNAATQAMLESGVGARRDAFLVELKEAVEDVPFGDFSEAVRLASNELVDFLDDKAIDEWVKSLKVPESPVSRAGREIDATRQQAKNARVAAETNSSFSDLVEKSLNLSTELDAVRSEFEKQRGVKPRDIEGLIAKKRLLAEEQMSNAISERIRVSRQETSEILSGLAIKTEADRRYAAHAIAAGEQLARDVEALRLAGANPADVESFRAAEQARISAESTANIEEDARALQDEVARARRAMAPVGSMFTEFGLIAKDAGADLAEVVAAMDRSGATSESKAALVAAKQDAAAQQIVDAFNSSSLSVDEHRIAIARAREALSSLGEKGAAAAEQLNNLAQPRDLGDLLGGFVGQAIDSLLGGMEISDSDRTAVVGNLSAALVDLIEGGELNMAAISKAIGQLIGGISGGAGGGGFDLGSLGSIVGALGGAGGATGAAGVGTAAAGTTGAAAAGAGTAGAGVGVAGGGAVAAGGGAAALGIAGGPLGAIIAAAAVAAFAVLGVAIGAAAAALQGFAVSIADVTGDARLSGAVSAAFDPMLVIAGTLTGLLTGLVVLLSPIIVSVGALAAVVATLLAAVSAIVATLTAVAAAISAVVSVVILVMTGALIPVMLAFAAVIIPVVIALVVVAAALALYYAAIFLAVGVIMTFVGAMVAGFGALAFLLRLSTETESFKRFQEAFGVVVDKLVKAMEPLWSGMIALAGLFDVFIAVLMPFADALTRTDFAARIVFEVFKVLAIVAASLLLVFGVLANFLIAVVQTIGTALIGLVTAMAPVVDAIGSVGNAFLSLQAGIFRLIAGFFQAIDDMIDGIEAMTGIDLPEQWAKDARNAALDSARRAEALISDVPFSNIVSDGLRSMVDGAGALRVDTGALSTAIDDLIGLTYDEAKARGDSLASMAELNEELTNVPEGFKVANARFRAIAADGATVTGGAAPTLGDQETQGSSTTFAIENLYVEGADPNSFVTEMLKESVRRKNRFSGGPFGDGINNGGG